MKDPLEPDYPDYSWEELQDALAHIDRERFHARYRRLLEEIERRGRGNPASS